MKQQCFYLLCISAFSLAFLRNSCPGFKQTRLFLSNRKYPLSKNYYENGLNRPNKTNTLSDREILGIDSEMGQLWNDKNDSFSNIDNMTQSDSPPRIRIMLGRNGRRLSPGDISIADIFNINNDESSDEPSYESFKRKKLKKSQNFEVISDHPVKFEDVGGYENVKAELNQCVDMLSNLTKYSKFNIRTPRGLIFEGPPGNGKTLLAKALAGEAKISFIPVSGSQFQDKYVGVGSSRIRELFDLASKHTPVIVFIDEIDALGRRRSGDGETSSSERDNTLNELLIAMDGFKNNSGVFIVGATNRADLLDPALLRPGRIDKRIYIGNPDAKTREAILRIHTRGKPYDAKISLSDLIDTTAGLSGAQIENLMNEAMINALRCDREMISKDDIDLIINKMMVGWQPTEHTFTSDIIDHIAIHEMGHAILGLLSKHHSKMSKVVINLSSPRSPAYTVFKTSDDPIYTREALFEHLMILLGGRIAEEVFYNISVTTGAINDFSEALKLAEKMIIDYGMGKSLIYPSKSQKYLSIIDDEVLQLLHEAYKQAEVIILKSKDFIYEASELLKRDTVVHAEQLEKLIRCKYSHLK